MPVGLSAAVAVVTDFALDGAVTTANYESCCWSLRTFSRVFLSCGLCPWGMSMAFMLAMGSLNLGFSVKVNDDAGLKFDARVSSLCRRFYDPAL